MNPDLPKYGFQDFFAIGNISNIGQGYTLPGGKTFRFRAEITKGASYFTIGAGSTHYNSIDVTGDSFPNLVKESGADAHYQIDVLNSSILTGVITDVDSLIASANVCIIILKQGYNAAGGFVTSGGSINGFGEKFPYLSRFDAMYMSRISGNLTTAFGKCIYMGRAQLQSTQVAGTIEALAESQWQNGRRSGTFQIQCNGIITYNGEAVAAGTFKQIGFTSSGYTII